MSRRLIVAVVTAGLLGGTAALAAAETPKNHMVCLINQGTSATSSQQGLCLNVVEPALPKPPTLP